MGLAGGGAPGRIGAGGAADERNCFSRSTISGVGGTIGRATWRATGVGRFGKGGRPCPGWGRLGESPLSGRRIPSVPCGLWLGRSVGLAGPGTTIRGGAMPGMEGCCCGRLRRISPGFGPVVAFCIGTWGGVVARTGSGIRGAAGCMSPETEPGAGRIFGGGSMGPGVALAVPGSGRKPEGRGGRNEPGAGAIGRPGVISGVPGETGAAGASVAVLIGVPGTDGPAVATGVSPGWKVASSTCSTATETGGAAASTG